MRIGMIGLGRMGASMVRRLLQGGHECVAYDPKAEAVRAAAASGARPARSLEELVRLLPPPRAVWIMVPAAIVDAVIGELRPLLSAGDVLVDGGNSNYHDDIRRAGELEAAGIRYLDVGTSGGVLGFEHGYCLMIGGEPEAVGLLELTAAALAQDGELAGFGGHVADSGEGRWSVEAAVETGVPAPVLSAALYARFESRGQAEFANKVLSAMRLGFGGHVEGNHGTP